MRGGALILGQRPTSPKGVQCYVGPLAHCGSHCCANCITTGSGRDLPSVARNSVSRGLVPALHNATATAHCYPRNTDVRRRSLRRRWDAVTFIALRYVIRRINAGTTYVHTSVTCRPSRRRVTADEISHASRQSCSRQKTRVGIIDFSSCKAMCIRV